MKKIFLGLLMVPGLAFAMDHGCNTRVIKAIKEHKRVDFTAALNDRGVDLNRPHQNRDLWLTPPMESIKALKSCNRWDAAGSFFVVATLVGDVVKSADEDRRVSAANQDRSEVAAQRRKNQANQAVQTYRVQVETPHDQAYKIAEDLLRNQSVNLYVQDSKDRNVIDYITAMSNSYTPSTAADGAKLLQVVQAYIQE